MSMQPYRGGQMQVGATNLGAGDFIPPRVKVVQQMSAEATRDKNPAKPGDFINTLTGENYGNEIKVVPLFTFMNRVFIVREDKKAELDKRLVAAGHDALPDGDGLMCRSIDTVQGQGDPGGLCAECPMSQWEGRTGAPPCSETYNMAAITEQGDVVFLQMSKSSAVVGKKMNSTLRFRTKAAWATFWIFSTEKQQNNRGTFFTPSFEVTSEATPPELMAEAQSFAGRFEGVAVDVTEVSASEDDPSSPPPF